MIQNKQLQQKKELKCIIKSPTFIFTLILSGTMHAFKYIFNLHISIHQSICSMNGPPKATEQNNNQDDDD